MDMLIVLHLFLLMINNLSFGNIHIVAGYRYILKDCAAV